jgi:hypothetical protein
MHINTAITWLKATSLEKTTLFILGSLHKAGREIYLTNKWLADRAGCSPQWMYKVLESLDSIDYIVCEECSNCTYHIEVNEDLIVQDGSEIFEKHSKERKYGVRLSNKI